MVHLTPILNVILGILEQSMWVGEENVFDFQQVKSKKIQCLEFLVNCLKMTMTLTIPGDINGLHTWLAPKWTSNLKGSVEVHCVALTNEGSERKSH